MYELRVTTTTQDDTSATVTLFNTREEARVAEYMLIEELKDASTIFGLNGARYTYNAEVAMLTNILFLIDFD
jgi:hypothetical protein